LHGTALTNSAENVLPGLLLLEALEAPEVAAEVDAPNEPRRKLLPYVLLLLGADVLLCSFRRARDSTMSCALISSSSIACSLC
jgi:hypothetical protein